MGVHPATPEALGWSLQPGLLLASALPAVLYVRGARIVRRRCPERFSTGRAVAFLAGLAVVLVALVSPLDPLADRWLSWHMLQHLLLMMVAPPLLWLGYPEVPLLRGLPGTLRKRVAGPILARRPVRALGSALAHPVVAWLSFVVATWVWHAPVCYEAALRHPWIHDCEHLSFLGTGLLFWRPIVQPWPSRTRGGRWIVVPYLLLAALENTAFSALFTFSNRVIYPSYAAFPMPPGTSALADQAVAGAIMWVGGSMAMLIAVVLVVVEALSPSPARDTKGGPRSGYPRVALDARR